MKTIIKYESEKGSSETYTVIKGDGVEIVAGLGVIISNIVEATNHDKLVIEFIKLAVDKVLDAKKEERN